MDRPTNVHELFSRGASPPAPPQDPSFQRPSYPQPNQPHPAAPNPLDALFHGIGNTSNQQQSSNVTSSFGAGSSLSSEPLGPISLIEEGPANKGAAQNLSSERERQNALLSLLGSVPPMPSTQNRGAPPAQSQPIAQASNTPETQSSSDQGKYLLDQLMSGAPPRSNYPDSQRPLPAPGPPASFAQQTPPVEEPFHSREASYSAQETPRDNAQRPQPQEPLKGQQPPSPSRKSMFEFVSPFDALAATKKKAAPHPGSSSSGNEDWTTASMNTDPKRRSVENLLDTSPRGMASHLPIQAPSVYDHYASGGEFSHTESKVQAPAPPMPTKPVVTGSPSSSSPKVQAIRQQPRTGESPVGNAGQPTIVPPSVSNRRDTKDTTPTQRSNWKGNKPPIPKGKNQSSPTQLQQTIIFDVSQPLDEIQAPPDSVKSTAIALVKQDSVFLPGTTIGATHWVAYAMTRGRVRVISRSSGDRTLLQLPSVFPSTSAVTDMAVFGNRLAGVTSDGGFVVWELPEEIRDDVPGQLILCLPPTMDSDALHTVKWHPKQSDTLAVASQTTIYLIDLVDASRISRVQPVPHSELHRISQVFPVSSRIVAFDFDVVHFAIATITEDSNLTIWNIRDKVPVWRDQVRGDDPPSSLTFVDGGIVVGRKNGTIFQLLSVSTKNVLSTIKFVHETSDEGMFGHVNYDSRMQTLWIANNRRDSMIALKLAFDPSLGAGDDNRLYLEQVVEFIGPKPTIHFVILTADADPTGEEAHAACMAAKVPPGELALVAFSVHSSGVDQILIRKEWYDAALASTAAKFPPYPGTASVEARGLRQAHQASPTVPPAVAANLARQRTPPSEEVEGDFTRDDGRAEPGRKGRARNVAWKDKEDNGKEKERNIKGGEPAVIGESALGLALSKEIRKTEESLHTRIGRLIGKEMDKQHQRLEDARAKDQAEDFARQEKILKLISNELTRNTTRVVEMAVKSEVQNSVLPALENVIQLEVKAGLNDKIGKGLSDFIQQSLPLEIEKLLLRPDISTHFAHLLSSNLTPMVERNVKEAINKTFLPMISQQTSAMHQDLVRELRAEILSVKKEFAVQNDAIRAQESLNRDLEHSIRALSDQVKFLSLNAPSVLPLHHHVGARDSPGQHAQTNISQHPIRQPAAPTNYGQNYTQQPQSSTMHGPWFPSSIAAPQASHPAPPPPPPQATTHTGRTPPSVTQQEEWDDTYLAVLGTQDPRQLRELLHRSNPDVVMPLNGPGPLSQAVILTLLHRLAAAVGETPPVDESFKSSLWWLQRTASTLNTKDPLISPYIARVVPNVQQMLNTTKQRLSIIPGGPQLLDTARTISEVQDTLSRKQI